MDTIFIEEIKTYIKNWIQDNLNLKDNWPIQQKLDYFIAEKTISCISFLTYKHISKRSKNNVLQTQKDIKGLCLATVLGWLSYEISNCMYDTQKHTDNIYVAQYALCVTHQIYAKFSLKKGSLEDYDLIIQKSFRQMYEAHIKEESLSFVFDSKDFSIFELAKTEALNIANEKSIGHSIGPLLILHLYLENLDFKKENLFQEAFRYYLIARQLHDDCLDAVSDFLKNKPTFVTVSLQQIINSQFNKTSVKTQEFVETIFDTFLFKKMCVEILKHTTQARKLFKKAGLTTYSFSETLLSPLEKPIRKTLN